MGALSCDARVYCRERARVVSDPQAELSDCLLGLSKEGGKASRT